MPHPGETERLQFREWLESDLDSLHAICADANVMQFVADGQPWSRVRTREFIASERERSQGCGYCRWALIHKSSGSLIGFCGLISNSHGAEVGWRLAQNFWGQGLATEAARAILQFGFATLKLDRIVASVQSANRASLRVIEKLRMQRESCSLRNGREVEWCAITLDQWCQRSADAQ